MSSVRATSLEAYEHINATGKAGSQRSVIYYTVARHPEGITRRALSDLTGFEINAVSGRVNQLVGLGLLAELPAVLDEVTKRHVIPVTANIRTEHCKVCQKPLIFAAAMPPPALGKYYCSSDCEREQREQYFEPDDGFY